MPCEELCFCRHLAACRSLRIVGIAGFEVVFFELRLRFAQFLLHLRMVRMVCAAADRAGHPLFQPFAELPRLFDLQEDIRLVQPEIAFFEPSRVAVSHVSLRAALLILPREAFDSGALRFDAAVALHDILPCRARR